MPLPDLQEHWNRLGFGPIYTLQVPVSYLDELTARLAELEANPPCVPKSWVDAKDLREVEAERDRYRVALEKIQHFDMENGGPCIDPAGDAYEALNHK